jgi:outer membrane receptor protein involved in Fe transport
VGIWTRTDGNGNPIVRAHDISQGHEINYKATGSMEAPLLGGTLKLNASVLIDPYHFQQQDLLIPPPGSDQEFQYNRQDTAEVGARYERALSRRLKVETYVLQQFGRAKATDDFTSDPVTAALTGDDESDHFKLGSRSRESIGRVILRYAALPTLSLEGGAEGDYNWLSTHTLFIENGAPVALPAAQVVVTEARGEAFVSAVWQARPTLTVEAGLRGEASHIASSGQDVSARSLYYPKPRLVVSWTPDASDTVRLRLEREVSQLNFNDFVAQTAGISTGTVHAGNPALNPERDWVIEGAWDRRFWNGGDATITLRHYKYTDVEDRVGVIDASSGIEFDAPGNIGAGTKDEAVFTLTLPTDRLGLKHGQLTGVATLRRSRVTDPTTGQAREISGLHSFDWELHYSQGVPRWKATWGFDVVGNWRQNQYHFDELDTFRIRTYIAPFVEYRPRADLTFKLELLNLTARGDEQIRRIYAGPRNIYPVLFTDDRAVGVGRFVRVTFIKSFG